MIGSLEDVLKAMDMLESIFRMHGDTSSSVDKLMLRDIYRSVRNDIKKIYQLEKGEFTHLYAFNRGRIDVMELTY